MAKQNDKTSKPDQITKEAPVMEAPIEDLGFVLPKETILVKYVKTQKGFITNEGHVAYGGKLEGAVDGLPARQNRSGKYHAFLTPQEQVALEGFMGVEKNFLSIHKTTDNFWDGINVGLPKEGLYLNLEDPNDYIKYKVLLSYEDFISPSILETKHKLTYRYEIVREADMNSQEQSEVSYDIQAYKLFGKYEDSREQLAGIIRVLSGKSASTNDHEWLIKEVGKLVKKSPKRFVEVLTDPNYQNKLFIERCISKRVILKVRGKYSTKDGIDLCEDGEQPTLMNAIKFLDNIKNQDIRLAIEAGL